MRPNLKPFHRWIPRVETFKTRFHVDRFWRTFFHEKTRQKNRAKKPNREHGFFPFRKRHARASREITTVTLVEAKPWLSWKEKNKNAFFSVSERHGHDSRESTTVPLAEAKPWLSRKKKNRKRVFFPFSRGTAVTLAKTQPFLSRKKKQKPCFVFTF